MSGFGPGTALERAISFGLRALPVACLLVTACQWSTPATPGEGELPARSLQAPPGSLEESAPGNYAQLLTQAQELEARRSTIRALRVYRQALEAAPADLPGAERQALVETIDRLAFVLGVTQGNADEARGGAASIALATAPEAQNVQASEPLVRARSLYAQAREKEQAGNLAEALELYLQIRTVITEKDDAPLYWNAWQRASDLSPEPLERDKGAAGPQPLVTFHAPIRAGSEAASGGGQEREESDGGEGDEGPIPNDGSVLPGNPRAVANALEAQGAGAAERLGKARGLYVKAMSAARTRDVGQAKTHLAEVLSLMQESQDPELYNAARQKLEELKKLP